MSLFPAYVQETSDGKIGLEDDRFIVEPCSDSLALEAQLLASDSEEREPAEPLPARAQGQLEQHDYYMDCKLDLGNLRVSTLYYPGRPQYNSIATWAALGGRRPGGGRAARARRYYSTPAPDAPPPHAELAQRTRAFRDLLALNPDDEDLWLRFIEFQERWRDEEAVLAAAGEAAARLPGSRRLRAALHRARAAALPPLRRLELLRAELRAGGATELWLRALGAAAAAGGAQLDAAAAAALAATRADPAAYPHVLYAYGAALRAAGLWEQLVLLLELVATMNFPPAAFPPPRDHQKELQQEELLQDYEDKVMRSGLPLSTVWVRVERARAAAHWRPAPGPGPAPADPQRAPLPADVAELLRPVAGPAAAALLLVQALRLAKVPLLPCSQYALAAADGANDAAGDPHEADGGEALLALLRAARRLPGAHAARVAPARAARVLAHFVDPPHYFSDDAGYLSWVTALWEAACEWTAAERRTALLCWRLRWLHALLLLVDTQEEAGQREAARIRSSARAALKRFAGASPLPFAHFARIELLAAGAASARRAALAALRSAARDPACAAHHRLYAARVAAELCGARAGAWATACAALGRALPPDDRLAAPPPSDLLRDALLQCEARCAELELAETAAAEAAEAADCDGVVRALLPAPAEWAAARARLASPARRAALVRAALEGGASRYWEQSACALVVCAAREQRQAQYARALAPLFPHNALLALASGGAPLWAWDARATHEQRLRALAAGARSHRAALARLLPLLGAAADWQPAAAARLAAAAARAARAGAAPLLLCARLEAAARAGRGAAAALAALEAAPRHKWLALRGAAWEGAEAAALQDVLLERGLRAHALLDELHYAP